MARGLITMSGNELDKLEIVQKIVDGKLKQKAAAEMLGITPRQIRRLLKNYKSEGAEGLLSKHRGKRSNRRHRDEFKENIMHHVQAEYSDFGPTLAAEKLLERQQLAVNKETLRQWMIESTLWKGKHRKTGVIHQQRARRPCFGELVQIDGSPHDWFEGRAPKCCLLVFIDDATSRLLSLRFEDVETTSGYFEATRSYIKQYGRPVSFYSDRHGIFRINIPEAESGTGETQFSRAMRELGIKVICANSPQAKGRVERANKTLQDRLVKELRLRNINDIDAANAYLPEFMEAHNKHFSQAPLNSVDAHRRELPSDDVLDLIFSFQETRTLSKNLEMSYKNIIYQIQTVGKGYQMRHAKITVYDNKQGTIKLMYKGKNLDFLTIDKKKRAVMISDSKQINAVVEQKIKHDGRSRGNKPRADHPWKEYEKISLKSQKIAA